MWPFRRRKEEQPFTIAEIQAAFHKRWEESVRTAHENPILAFGQIHRLVADLNTRASVTNHKFLILPVVNGVTSPDVAPIEPIVRIETTGPEVEKLLETLPRSVRRGEDENYSVHQIRLDDFNSYEHQIGTTTLLAFFLVCHQEQDRSYLFSADQMSHTNWDVLMQMHTNSFGPNSKRKK